MCRPRESARQLSRTRANELILPRRPLLLRLQPPTRRRLLLGLPRRLLSWQQQRAEVSRPHGRSLEDPLAEKLRFVVLSECVCEAHASETDFFHVPLPCHRYVEPRVSAAQDVAQLTYEHQTSVAPEASARSCNHFYPAHRIRNVRQHQAQHDDVEGSCNERRQLPLGVDDHAPCGGVVGRSPANGDIQKIRLVSVLGVRRGLQVDGDRPHEQVEAAEGVDGASHIQQVHRSLSGRGSVHLEILRHLSL
mmetsp:Transcript_85479/g.217929  ORF Transcript_85479/g.217929 Transcript_85479/m.217929 type:complete len:249 (+) Transcript_85479:86-832(+)